MRFFQFIVILFFTMAFHANALEAERLFYLSNGQVLTGCLYKPKGKGPFPVVIFNQNVGTPFANGNMDPFPQLAEFYIAHGYVLFAPGRQPMKDEENTEETNTSDTETDAVSTQRKAMNNHQAQAETVFAAMQALKAQSYVDHERIFISGQAGGAVTTMLMAEKDLNVRGYVVFSPGSTAWKRNLILQNELKRTIKEANAPVFLIQPENDFSLLPVEVLGKELKKKGAPNRVKVYPAFGKTPKDSPQIAVRGPHIWGRDVLSFFEECLKQQN